MYDPSYLWGSIKHGGIITSKEDYNLFLTIIKKINSLFYRQVPEISHGDIIEWDVSSIQLKQGEELMISGKTKPDKSIKLDVNFEMSIPVNDNRYEHRFDDVAINSIPNEFHVEAYDVKNMTFTVRMLMPFKQYREAENGRAIYIDKDVPSGNYDIIINGDTESVENVLLKIKASQTIVSDSEGNFVYGYPTKAFPVGPINLFLGQEEKEIKIIP
ncbi:hypothetical protein JEZ13_00535 [bacterium]|nr:hypothetical protein [bacterium]MBI9073639.1 hypothetical protein [Melioribacteraceae bacterium]